MLRFVFVGALVILLVVPIYNLLKRRTTRIQSELESEPEDTAERFAEIEQKKKKLKKILAELVILILFKEKQANKLNHFIEL